MNLGYSPEWHDEGSCNGPEARAAARSLGVETTEEVWFPDKSHAQAAYALVRPICLACPVYDRCLAEITAHPSKYGMWAGLAPEDRKGLRVVATPQQKESTTNA